MWREEAVLCPAVVVLIWAYPGRGPGGKKMAREFIDASFTQVRAGFSEISRWGSHCLS